MNLAYLERQLRAGKTPEQLGAEPIGKGCQKTAYRLGNLVIKESGAGWNTGKRRPPAFIYKYARFVRQYKAGNYVLQEYVTPLRDQKTGEWNFDMSNPARQQWQVLYKNCQMCDVHEYNCGVNANGELVVFDF